MENTSTNNAPVLVKFPNGNSIVGPSVLQYAERYQNCLNQTAESILALTETVYEAKQSLTDAEFNQFKEEVGLKSKSTVSKFLAIGQNSSRLKGCSDRLPHAWTTLYRLVQLTDDEFSLVENSICPEMTGAMINRLLNLPVASSASVTKDLPDVKLYLNKLDFGQQKGFLKELTKLLMLYQVNFKTSGDFEIEVKKMRCSSAAYILKFPKGHQYPSREDEIMTDMDSNEIIIGSVVNPVHQNRLEADTSLNHQ